jgi:catechol 2,3-dioxygenase
MMTSGSIAYGLPPPGYRLPAETRVGLVRLQVSDLERSIAYYEQVLGFRAQRDGRDSATLGVQGGGPPLVRLETRRGVTPARRGAFGLYHFAILLPNRAALGRFATHLASTSARVGMADHLVSEALYLWDPDGLGIEVYRDRERSEWRHRAREVLMATDPLDIKGVIAAADGVWTGMPAGTTIGHVHLHVGDLGQAEAFYHSALGLDKMAWTYPGALFLAAGGYHHHLGTNVWSSGPSAADLEARLLDWELVVPRPQDAAAAAESLRRAGHSAEREGNKYAVPDPWGTRLRIVAANDASR